MTMIEIRDQILTILFECWKYDIEVFSKPWIYWCLCIPAFFYLIFFMLKWTVLTAPIWLPISLIFKGFTLIKITKKDSK